MPVFWLDESDLSFPPPQFAESSGLLAISQDLRPERVVAAYQSGIFPWYEHEGFFYWYSPDPRLVLFPSELRVHKSMRSIFNRRKFDYTFDTAFESVMRACAQTPRAGQVGTWICEDFITSYTALHQRGIAHSVEVWQNGEMVGGLYGLALGRVFFGESMFTRVPNASKAGFIVLVRALQQSGFRLIDCQQETEHLKSLGARPISRKMFLEMLRENASEPTLRGRWLLQEDYRLVALPC